MSSLDNLVSSPGWPRLCLVVLVLRKAGKVLEKHGSHGMGPEQLGLGSVAPGS